MVLSTFSMTKYTITEAGKMCSKASKKHGLHLRVSQVPQLTIGQVGLGNLIRSAPGTDIREDPRKIGFEHFSMTIYQTTEAVKMCRLQVKSMVSSKKH